MYDCFIQIKGDVFLKKVISCLMVLSLFLFTLLNASGNVSANTGTMTDTYDRVSDVSTSELNQKDDFILENEAELEYSTYALPLAPIIGLLLKKMAKEAVKQYGKQAVIDAVMDELNLPKTISGKNLIKKLKKVGFEEVRQKGSHVTMKGPNGKTFTVPLHKEIAKGTYDSIKKSIKNSIAP